MNEADAPVLSVVMPVYNSSLYLREAIDSILSQTFADFEFLIVDDGSTDDSKEIILSYQDKRIKFIGYKENAGLSARLNTAIETARGTYIARMDSDDIAMPDRFQKQLFFLQQNETVAVCGGFMEFIGTDVPADPINWVKYMDSDLIKINLLFDCALCHPTVMFRKEILAKSKLYYNSSYEPAEDYKLWLQLTNMQLKLVNIPDTILQFRINGNQVSTANDNQQRKMKFKIMHEQLVFLGIVPTKNELLLHDHLFFQAPVMTYDYLSVVKAWVDKLITANENASVYEPVKFEGYLNDLMEGNAKAYCTRLVKMTVKEKAKFYLKKIFRIGSVNQLS